MTDPIHHPWGFHEHGSDVDPCALDPRIPRGSPAKGVMLGLLLVTLLYVLGLAVWCWWLGWRPSWGGWW